MNPSDIEPILESDETEPKTYRTNQQYTNESSMTEYRTDRFNLVYILFFMIGLSQLLPFNFLITADDLWMYKFRDFNSTNTNEKSELQKFFSSYLVIACNAPFLLVYLLIWTKYFQRISIDWKNCVAFFCTISIFVIITSLVIINTDQYQFSFLIVLLFLVFILNSSTIIIQANFTSAASLFPLKYMHSMVNGQAVSGIFAAFAKIFTLIGDRSLSNSVFIFFALADLILMMTFWLYLFIRKKPFYQLYSSSSSTCQIYIRMDFSLLAKIFKQIWPFCLTLMFVFWITIGVYPTIFVLITPSNYDTIIPQKFIIPLTCFFIFNIGDFLGRYLGRYFLLTKDHGHTLLIISILRIVFIPLFLYCNAQPRHHIVLFDSEIEFILFNLIFALLNGYLVFNVFVNSPLLIPEEYRHLSGYFLIAFLGLGLTLGSLTSPFVLDLL